MGHTPSTHCGLHFPEEIPEKLRQDPGNALRAFPGIPLESTVEYAKPYNSRHLKPSEHFQNCLPPLFSEVVPERTSQSCSWNSQQY